jgi:Family of unknown function (DUF5522)
MNNLAEGEDYYYNEQGYIVLTEKYHLQRGYCCGNGCKHCPYHYENVPEPKRSELKAAYSRQGGTRGEASTPE